MAEYVWDVDYLSRQRGTFYQGDWPTIGAYFHHNCRRFPERPCFIAYGADAVQLNYREVEQRVLQVAGLLRSLGVTKGQRVALSGKNAVPWGLVYLAVVDLGAVVVPLDARLSIDRRVALARFAECVLFFTDGDLEQWRGQWPEEALCSLSGEHGVLSRAAELNDPVEPVGYGCDEIAAILFTSGTTGNEKGVVLTHRNLVVNTAQAAHPAYIKIFPEDRFYLLLPMHHIYPMTGVFLEALFHGSAIVFPQGLALPLILDDLKQGSISVLMGVPLFYTKVLRGLWRKIRAKGAFAYGIMSFFALLSRTLRPLFGSAASKLLFASVRRGMHFDSMRVMISGGGPLDAAVVLGFRQLGLEFIEGYGLSEAAPILTINPAEKFRLGSVGKVLPLLELRIDNPDENGVGEVLARGENVFKGYYKNPQVSAEALDEEGWLHTGDVGYLDGDNYLFLTGRKKLMIVTTAGKNIFPEEVENRFQLCPQIAQVAVREYQDSRFDSPLEALIFPDAEFFQDRAAEEDICQVVRQVNHRLRSYERILRVWVLAHELPVSGTAKIRRHLIPDKPEGAKLYSL